MANSMQDWLQMLVQGDQARFRDTSLQANLSENRADRDLRERLTREQLAQSGAQWAADAEFRRQAHKDSLDAQARAEEMQKQIAVAQGLFREPMKGLSTVLSPIPPKESVLSADSTGPRTLPSVVFNQELTVPQETSNSFGLVPTTPNERAQTQANLQLDVKDRVETAEWTRLKNRAAELHPNDPIGAKLYMFTGGKPIYQGLQGLIASRLAADDRYTDDEKDQMAIRLMMNMNQDPMLKLMRGYGIAEAQANADAETATGQVMTKLLQDPNFVNRPRVEQHTIVQQRVAELLRNNPRAAAKGTAKADTELGPSTGAAVDPLKASIARAMDRIIEQRLNQKK